MRLFGKSKPNETDFIESDDRLVMIDVEKHTSDIVFVDQVTDTHIISTGKYSVPKADCEVTTSPNGRVYIVKAQTHVISELERIARLERSVVLQQLTNYKPPKEENPNMDMKFWALAALLFVAIIVAAF